jgi:hypothetical protein
MAERVVRGNLRAEGDVPINFIERFVVADSPELVQQWHDWEKFVHRTVDEDLWPLAALFFGSAFRFRSRESKEQIDLWSSLLSWPRSRIRKGIDEILKQIDRGRERQSNAQ